MPFEPHQSLAGCITNIRQRLPACDWVIAEHNGVDSRDGHGPRSRCAREAAAVPDESPVGLFDGRVSAPYCDAREQV
jgi:hypothetical protein